ncbi:unnamed protein product [Callosobruchus maculatus]|uniref:Uncharacterized protein n=1 Tax=Callosobruchus maculatus TaxID=64391 RepID=A0A653CLC3_CALMS|nr:unnamed protein product [Callosobruchus maculatus]
MIDVTTHSYPQDEISMVQDVTPSYQASITASITAYPSQLPSKAMHEIIPGVYLGSFSAAQTSSLLVNGINYIICVRQEYEAHFIKPQVSDPAFTYLTLDIEDNVTENIIRFFPKVRQFIDDALSHNCKVLVHCDNGNSRSATLVLAYLMEKYGLSTSEALRYVRERRESVNPNEGFRAQLIEYEPIYKARQIMANGESSSDCRQKRKYEQLTETVDYNLIQRPPSPDLENNNHSYAIGNELSTHLLRLLKEN